MSQWPLPAPPVLPPVAFAPQAPAGQNYVRWGSQVSFWQRSQPAFWLFIGTLLVTGFVFVGKQLTMIQSAPEAWFLTLLLLAPFAIPVALFIYVIDSYEPEPKSILLAALAWGGIAATTLALYTNTPIDELIFKLTNPTFSQDWGAAFTAPFVEEGYKALGMILLVSIARPELDDIIDGFVWGAMIGIGFLVVEDVFYFMNAFVEANGDFAGIFQIFVIRVIGAGPYSHFLYTGLTGMGIAYYATRLDQPKYRRLLGGLGLAALGVGSHFFWNSPFLSSLAGDGSLTGFLAYATVKGLPLLIGLTVVVQLARSRDRRWFAHLAANPLIEGEISAADLRELGGLWRRVGARRRAGRMFGRVGSRLRGMIQRQQIALAVAASHAQGPDDPTLQAERQTLHELEAQFGGLRSVTAGAIARPGSGSSAGPWTGSSAGPGSGVWVPAGEAPPPPAATMLTWSPTHAVPAEGMTAWAAPDPRAPGVALAGGLPVAVAERVGDWARVVASNGWSGWVDGRRLD